MPEAFGRYELLSPIGAGGMAEVFKARLQVPAGAEKILVIKRIRPSVSEDPELLQLFVNEAKIALPLTHGNITSVYEFGEEVGRYYLAMEYIHGQDLAAALAKSRARGTPVPVEAALLIAAEVAKGLAYAHGYTAPAGERVEVIHGDVSPSNILLSYDGAAKLTDFGIARLRSAEPASKKIRGKASYLAPEVAAGKAADGRADVYSLGCVLYEALTLRRPFEGESDREVVSKAAGGDVVPPSVYRPGIEALDELVLRAMSTDPGERFVSASDFQVALSQALFARAPRYGGPELAAWLKDLFAWEILEEQGMHAQDRVLFAASRASDAPTKELFGLSEASAPGADAKQEMASATTAAQEAAESERARVRWRAAAAALGVVAVMAGAAWLVGRGSGLGFAPEASPEGEGARVDGGGARAGGGVVSLNAWPSAVVTVDGVRLPGRTPILAHRLDAGRHTLVFENPERALKKEVTLDVAPGAELSVAVTLDR